MKVRVQQLNPIIGDIEGNTAAIKNATANAEEADINLLLLPELVVCGYSPMDFFERPAFRNEIYKANKEIANHTGKTAIIFGTITPNDAGTGKSCFNSAVFVHQGEIKAEIHKTLLPTYNVYDELRYFEPGITFECIEFKGRKIGVTICEDIWCNFGNNPSVTYEKDPVQTLADAGGEAIFNLSASPFDKKKFEVRAQMLREQIENVNLPVFYANQVGGNTDLISDGDSMVIDRNQSIIARAPLFKEAFIDVEWTRKSINNLGDTATEEPPEVERTFKALTFGLKEYLRKSGLDEKVIVGLSGGIDSALTACIAAEAIGAENVRCAAMPSGFSSDESVTDARALAENLGVKLEKIAVKDVYYEYLKTLKPLFKDTSFGVAEENLQARIRGMLLMALSNKFGGLVLNTGNKSELAVGYFTLYGDGTGALAVIGDLYKTEVYEMARWLNETNYQKEIIPQSILKKPPSAELKPDQLDSDSLPPYDVLDPILKLYIERRKSVDEIIAEGYDKRTVKEVVRLIHRNEFKRNQSPLVLKTSYVSFGTGLRWPVVERVAYSLKSD